MAIEGSYQLGGILDGYKKRIANASTNTLAMDSRMGAIFKLNGGKSINLNTDSSVHGDKLDIQEGQI